MIVGGNPSGRAEPIAPRSAGCLADTGGRDRAHRARRLEFVFSLFPVLSERADQRAGTLSGGQQQTLAIARALMLDPRLLMLDEPSLGLSPVLVDQIMEALLKLHRERGMIILLVEQNVPAALELCERGYVLQTRARPGTSGPNTRPRSRARAAT